MSDQLALALDVPRAAVGRARRTDPATSHEAARRPRSGLMALVHATLEDNPQGLTDWDLLIASGLPDFKRGSVVKRRQDCGAVPVLVDGKPLTRLSPDGCPCTVWRLPS